MSFANQTAFDDPLGFHLAIGQNIAASGAVTDSNGNTLFRLQTGGIIGPQRIELGRGAVVYRFDSSRKGTARTAMNGGWWVQGDQFDRILRFAQINQLSDPMAARILLGVPPEWSDMDLLVKCRVREPLLAWRGLANSVFTPYPAGGPQVVMLHQNANSERRLHQLFVPGLAPQSRGGSVTTVALTFEGEWRFAKAETTRGWIYSG